MSWFRMGMVTVGLAMATAMQAEATVIPVGSGNHQAAVVINFKDGAAYEFAVSFDGTTTGMELLDIIQSQTSLTTVKQDFGWGAFVDGFSFEGHSNAGFGGGDDWWQYWTKESSSADWNASFTGVSDRIVSDGAWDGWVYGRATAPVVPEPSSLVVLSVGASLLLVRRRG
ncbi:MAG: PEP-CTERM sorting domain-containing protein [Bacillota bacterium]